MPKLNIMFLVQFEWDGESARPYPVGIGTTHEAADEVAARYRESRGFEVTRVWQEVTWGEWRLAVASTDGKTTGHIVKLALDSFNNNDAHEAFTTARTQIR
jgi:subtilisin-like proprotein convertase family protein